MRKYRIIIAVLLIVFILAGCTIEMSSTSKDKINTVSVNNIDELLEAIAPNTTIYVNDGVYNITTASKYGKADASKYYSWGNYGYDYEYELKINGIDNLTIEGENAEIVTEPRSSNVLSFINCDNLNISGVKIGHTEAAEACEGGVVLLSHCKNVIIENSALYGCGTTGVIAYESNNISLTGSEIYHCSVSGVTFGHSEQITIDNCSFYDCGNSSEHYNAQGIFVMYDDTQNVVINNCKVYDNNAQTIIESYDNALSNISISGLEVEGNHLDYLVNCAGQLNIEELQLNNNIINSWFGYSSAETVLDGRTVNDEMLTERWGDQLSSNGIGAADAQIKTIDKSGTEEIHVSTADEFLAALKSNVTIYIDVPQINLTDASDYGVDASGEYINPIFDGKPYVWNNVYDGYQLYIGYLENLNIIGGEIITEPRYANVLNFYGCSNIGLENLKLGHSPAQSECAGGVLYFYCSDNVIIENCDLYGCGIMGIQSEYSSELNIQNTLIHDCSYQAGEFYNSLNISFINCSVVNCPQPNFTVKNCKNFIWNNRLMSNECSFNAE